MLSVFFITVFVDLITAVGVGIVLASLLIVYRITQETEIVLQNEDEGVEYNVPKDTRVLKINGAFFFGSSVSFEREASSILNIKKFIIDISAVPFIDLTAIFTLKDLINKLKNDGIKVIVVANEKEQKQLQKFNINGIFDEVDFYMEIKSCL